MLWLVMNKPQSPIFVHTNKELGLFFSLSITVAKGATDHIPRNFT
jgi:hypothetical protein